MLLCWLLFQIAFDSISYGTVFFMHTYCIIKTKSCLKNLSENVINNLYLCYRLHIFGLPIAGNPKIQTMVCYQSKNILFYYFISYNVILIVSNGFSAVYLCKRTMQNKTRLELADYEAESLARLQKMFSRKWEFIFMQAEAQSKVDKKRDKLERKVLDSQERAFWDVHRPMVIMFYLYGILIQ